MKKLWTPLIFGLIGVSILLNLGFWQVRRLAWKEALIAELNIKLEAPAIPLSAVTAFEDGLLIKLEGHFAEGYTDKLTGDNKQGAGYMRIVPFESKGRRFALELGFIPEAHKKDPFRAPKDMIELMARVYSPKSEGSFDARLNVWVGYDVNGIAERLQTEPVLLVAETSPIPGIDSRPYRNELRNDHLQYAITWFLLALAWLAMSAYWGYSRIRKTQG